MEFAVNHRVIMILKLNSILQFVVACYLKSVQHSSYCTLQTFGKTQRVKGENAALQLYCVKITEVQMMQCDYRLYKKSAGLALTGCSPLMDTNWQAPFP